LLVIKLKFDSQNAAEVNNVAVNIFADSVTNRQFFFRSRHISRTPTSWKPNCWRCACKHRRFPISGKTV